MLKFATEKVCGAVSTTTNKITWTSLKKFRLPFYRFMWLIFRPTDKSKKGRVKFALLETIIAQEKE